MTNAQQASSKLKVLQNRGINNRAMEELSHELDLWEKHTGKKLSGRLEGYEMTAPKGTTKREKDLLNSIIDTFLQDETTSIKSIEKKFDELPTSVKKSGKEYSIGEKAHALDVAERMRKEQVIKNVHGSDQYNYMWSIYKDNYKDKYTYKDYLEAMYAVTADDSDISNIETMVLGEGLHFDKPTTDADFEDTTIEYLLNVMEARR